MPELGVQTERARIVDGASPSPPNDALPTLDANRRPPRPPNMSPRGRSLSPATKHLNASQQLNTSQHSLPPHVLSTSQQGMDFDQSPTKASGETSPKGSRKQVAAVAAIKDKLKAGTKEIVEVTGVDVANGDMASYSKEQLIQALALYADLVEGAAQSPFTSAQALHNDPFESTSASAMSVGKSVSQYNSMANLLASGRHNTSYTVGQLRNAIQQDNAFSRHTSSVIAMRVGHAPAGRLDIPKTDISINLGASQDPDVLLLDSHSGRSSPRHAAQAQAQAPSSPLMMGRDHVQKSHSSQSFNAGLAFLNQSSGSAGLLSAQPSLGLASAPSFGSVAFAGCHTNTAVIGEDNDGFKTINQYTIVGKLGKGAFAKVKLAMRDDSETPLALKIMKKSLLKKMITGGQSAFTHVQAEIAIMKKMRHRHIVPLLEVIDDPGTDKLYLVMPYLENGAVITMGNDGKCEPLEPNQARTYFKHCVSGLQYLHRHGVVHRDIKPENMLVAKDGTLHLADFGVSTLCSSEDDYITGMRGTPPYLSPEVCRGEGDVHGFAVDVWALGITLFAFLFGSLPFYGDSMESTFHLIQNHELTIPTGTSVSEKAIDLLTHMLDKDPRRRYTVHQITEHPYICDDMVTTPDTNRVEVLVMRDEVMNAIKVSQAPPEYKMRKCKHRRTKIILMRYLGYLRHKILERKASNDSALTSTTDTGDTRSYFSPKDRRDTSSIDGDGYIELGIGGTKSLEFSVDEHLDAPPYRRDRRGTEAFVSETPEFVGADEKHLQGMPPPLNMVKGRPPLPNSFSVQGTPLLDTPSHVNRHSSTPVNRSEPQPPQTAHTGRGRRPDLLSTSEAKH